jgi:cytoskeletal protein RodZ
MTSEKEMSLGEFLRHERELRGITIEQVASATKVGVRTLHSLEADQYVELPAKPFVRGFVTSYCRFIGLDAKEVVSKFDQFITVKSTEQRPRKDSGHSGYAFEKRDGDQQSRTFLFFAIFGFILIGGITMLIFKPSLHSRRHKSHIEKLKAAHSPDPFMASQETASIGNSFSLEAPSLGTSLSVAKTGSFPQSEKKEASPLDSSGDSNVALTPASTQNPISASNHTSFEKNPPQEGEKVADQKLEKAAEKPESNSGETQSAAKFLKKPQRDRNCRKRSSPLNKWLGPTRMILWTLD